MPLRPVVGRQKGRYEKAGLDEGRGDFKKEECSLQKPNLSLLHGLGYVHVMRVPVMKASNSGGSDGPADCASKPRAEVLLTQLNIITPQRLMVCSTYGGVQGSEVVAYSCFLSLYSSQAQLGATSEHQKLSPSFGLCLLLRDHHMSQPRERKSLLRWVLCQGGQVPPGAVPGGWEKDNPVTFIGRVSIRGGTHVGRVVPRRKCCFAVLKAMEHRRKTYEVI